MNWLEYLLYALADYPQLLIYTLTILIKGSAVLLLAVLITTGMRNTAPAKQSLIVRLSLFAVVLLPVLSAICPGFEITLGGLFTSEWRGTVSSISMEYGAPNDNFAGGLAEFPWAVWLILLWLAGVMTVSSRVALGTVLSAVVVRRAMPVSDGVIKSVAEKLIGELGIRRKVRVAISTATDSPFVFGVFRPTVVLPPIATEWSANDLRMILLHELAHIKRNDLVWVYVSLFVGAVYWFNPLSWIVRRKLTIESDKACDDYVVCAGADKLAYAQHLLVILRSLRRSYAPVAIGVGMARRTQMEGRLMSILSDRRRVAGLRRSLVVWTTALTLLLLLPLAIVEIQAADPTGEQPAQKDTSQKEKQLQAKESQKDWPSPDDTVIVDVSPEMISTEPVVYPEDAKKAGITGAVWVKALIDEDGVVRQVLVHKSSGNEQLDEAAAKAATNNKFKPALKDGRPVPVWVSYKINFVLDDEDSGKSH